jgi:hypothetical protein
MTRDEKIAKLGVDIEALRKELDELKKYVEEPKKAVPMGMFAVDYVKRRDHVVPAVCWRSDTGGYSAILLCADSDQANRYKDMLQAFTDGLVEHDRWQIQCNMCQNVNELDECWTDCHKYNAWQPKARPCQ